MLSIIAPMNSLDLNAMAFSIIFNASVFMYSCLCLRIDTQVFVFKIQVLFKYWFRIVFASGNNKYECAIRQVEVLLMYNYLYFKTVAWMIRIQIGRSFITYWNVSSGEIRNYNYCAIKCASAVHRSTQKENERVLIGLIGIKCCSYVAFLQFSNFRHCFAMKASKLQTGLGKTAWLMLRLCLISAGIKFWVNSKLNIRDPEIVNHSMLHSISIDISGLTK